MLLSVVPERYVCCLGFWAHRLLLLGREGPCEASAIELLVCSSPVPLPASESTPSPSFRSPALLSVGVCGIYLGIVASSSVPVPSHVYGLGAARPLRYLSFLRHLANSSGSPPAVLPVYLPFHPPPSGDSASPPAGQELGGMMAVRGWGPRRGSCLSRQ